MTSKNVLMVTGALVLLMGLWGLGAYLEWVPGVSDVVDPWWHSVAKIVVGAVGVYVASGDR